MASVPVQVRHTVGGAVEFSVQRCGDDYSVHAPGIATYTIDARGALLSSSRDECDEDLVRSFYRCRIAPLVRQLQGTPSFHGGGVVTSEGAIAFLGRSGAGKSTLVASFASRFPILGDDCVVVECVGDRAVARPVDPRIRLWEDSRSRFAADTPWKDELGKPEIVGRLAEEPATLARIYLPQMGEVDTVTIEPLGRRDALVSLASNGYRLDPTHAGLLEREVAFFEAVATRTPVARLRYPRDFDRIEEVHAAILDHARDR